LTDVHPGVRQDQEDTRANVTDNGYYGYNHGQVLSPSHFMN
jgi:hypothetical protein